MILSDNKKRYNMLKDSTIINELDSIIYNELPKLPEEINNKIDTNEIIELSLRYKHLTTENILKYIKSYINLEYLDLSYNNITSLPRGLPRTIKAIDFSYNKISSLYDYPIYCQLIELHLSYNQLTTTKGLGSITTLQYINISNNKIHIIEDIEMLTSLHTLNLSNNCINTTLSLRLLSFNKSLKSLDITNNPVTKNEKAFKSVIKDIVPSLENLNGNKLNRRIKSKSPLKYSDTLSDRNLSIIPTKNLNISYNSNISKDNFNKTNRLKQYDSESLLVGLSSSSLYSTSSIYNSLPWRKPPHPTPRLIKSKQMNSQNNKTTNIPNKLDSSLLDKSVISKLVSQPIVKCTEPTSWVLTTDNTLSDEILNRSAITSLLGSPKVKQRTSDRSNRFVSSKQIPIYNKSTKSSVLRSNYTNEQIQQRNQSYHKHKLATNIQNNRDRSSSYSNIYNSLINKEFNENIIIAQSTDNMVDKNNIIKTNQSAYSILKQIIDTPNETYRSNDSIGNDTMSSSISDIDNESFSTTHNRSIDKPISRSEESLVNTLDINATNESKRLSIALQSLLSHKKETLKLLQQARLSTTHSQ